MKAESMKFYTGAAALGLLLSVWVGPNVRGQEEVESPPKESDQAKFRIQGDQLLIPAGEIPISHILMLLSDTTAIPLILGDSALDPRMGKIVLNEEIRLRLKKNNVKGLNKETHEINPPPTLQVEGSGSIITLLRKSGIDVQRVVLSSGKEILEARSIPFVDGKPAEPIVFRPSSRKSENPERTDSKPRLANMSEGPIPIGEVLEYFADITGEEVIYQGRQVIADPAGPSQGKIKAGVAVYHNPVDLTGVEAEIIREILEGQGFRVRHIIAEDGRRRHHIYHRADSRPAPPKMKRQNPGSSKRS